MARRQALAGIALFTVLLVWALSAYNRFLDVHPEARSQILGLAFATVLVYALGVAMLARLGG